MATRSKNHGGRIVPAAAFAIGVLTPGAAFAAAPPTAPAQKVLTGAVDVGIFADRQVDQDVASVSPLLRLGLRPRPEVELGLSFGAATLTADHDIDGRVREVRPSNFVLGTRWVRDSRATKHRGSVGFAFALPTNLHAQGRETEALNLALAARAGLDPWQWTPATLGVVVPGGWSFHLARFTVGLDGALAGMFAAAGNPDLPGLAAQLRGHTAYVHPWITAGVHVSGAYNGRADDDRSAFNVGPLAKVPLCFGERRGPACPIAAAAQVNLNVENQTAPRGDGLDVWGIQVGLEWSLDDFE